MKASNIRNKINIIKNVILNTEYKKDPRIWVVLIQSLNGDGKYQDDCGVRMKKSPESASIFIPLETGRFSLCYWMLEKAQWGMLGKICSCLIQYGIQNWGVEKREFRAANKGKMKKNKDTLQSHPVLMGRRKNPLTNPGGPQAEKFHCQRYWSTFKEGQLPKCPAFPFLWEDKLCWQELCHSHHDWLVEHCRSSTNYYVSFPISIGLPWKAEEGNSRDPWCTLFWFSKWVHWTQTPLMR